MDARILNIFMKIVVPAAVFVILVLAAPTACRSPVQTESGSGDRASVEQGKPASSSDLRLAPLPPKEGEKTWTCPFCGMKLREGESAATFEHDGKTYHFCTRDHMEAFKKNPEMYLELDSAEDN
jgi:YHS domain-containing protein